MVKLKKIEFKGNTFTFKNDKELASKLNVPVKIAKEYREGKRSQIYVKDNLNRFAKINIKDAETNNVLNKFNIKKVSNLDLLQGSILKRDGKNIIIDNKKFKGNDKISLAQIYVDLQITISEDIVERQFNFNYTGTINDLSNRINSEIQKYINDIEKDAKSVNVLTANVGVFSRFTNQQFSYNNDTSTLEKMNPVDISTVFNVDINNGLGCVNNMIRKMTPFKPKFGDIVSRNELIKYCNDKIHLVVYSIKGNIIYDNNLDVKYKICFIDYAGHCYPLINGKLSKKKYSDVEKVEYCNINKKIVECYEQCKFPYNITTQSFDKETIINSFICDGIKYINSNSKHKKVVEILQTMCIDEEVKNPKVSLSAVFEILEKQNNINVESYFPVSFSKSQLEYKTNKKIDSKRVVSIDNNKCYSSCLSSLEYIISVDYRTATIKKEKEITEIVGHYLYVAEPIDNRDLKDNILMWQKNIYSGDFIIYCKEQGLNIAVYEEISTTKHINKYGGMIKDIYNFVDEKDAKTICNISIGKFKKETEVIDINEVIGIFKNDELKVYEGNRYKIDDNYSLLIDVCKRKTVKNIYNKAPINIQIKDESRKRIYDKIQELKINVDDIVQIKTDSISYYGKLPVVSNEFGKWKENKFEEMGNVEFRSNDYCTFEIEANNNNKLFNCNAGWGKTYDIIHEVTKKYKDSIVITPSHKTCEAYRKENINCNVIQAYIYQNKIPKEDVIIIDEIGLFSKNAHDIIIKCFELGKKIIAYGDFNQLPPTDCESDIKYYNSLQYINMMFGNQEIYFKNMRNNFTEEYYKSLIDETINYIDEIKKYNCKKYYDADIILTYTKVKRDEYNDKMMKRNKLKLNSIGCKVICKTNALKYKNIYNGFNFIITNNESGGITLDSKINITKKQLFNNFIPYYASTLYSFQGQDIKSFYYPIDDKKELYFIGSGKTAYTLISRLKQDIVKIEDIVDNKFLVIFD